MSEADDDSSLSERFVASQFEVIRPVRNQDVEDVSIQLTPASNCTGPGWSEGLLPSYYLKKMVVIYTYEGSFSGVMMFEVMNNIYSKKCKCIVYHKYYVRGAE